MLPEGYGFEWTDLALQEKLAGNTASMAFGLGVAFVFLAQHKIPSAMGATARKLPTAADLKAALATFCTTKRKKRRTGHDIGLTSEDGFDRGGRERRGEQGVDVADESAPAGRAVERRYRFQALRKFQGGEF